MERKKTEKRGFAQLKVKDGKMVFEGENVGKSAETFFEVLSDQFIKTQGYCPMCGARKL